MSGIIRRIDDLGRVIIPKEIRRTLRIREGDPFEITVDKESRSVVLTPYMPLADTFANNSRSMLGSLRHTCPDFNFQIYDAAGNFTNVQTHQSMESEVSAELFELAEDCRTMKRVVRYPATLTAAVPIMCDGDFLGVILLRPHREVTDASIYAQPHNQGLFSEAVAAANVMSDFFAKFFSGI